MTRFHQTKNYEFIIEPSGELKVKSKGRKMLKLGFERYVPEHYSESISPEEFPPLLDFLQKAIAHTKNSQ